KLSPRRNFSAPRNIISVTWKSAVFRIARFDGPRSSSHKNVRQRRGELHSDKGARIDRRASPISDRTLRREHAALSLCGNGQARFTLGKISFHFWRRTLRAAGERREQFQDGKRSAVSAGVRAGFIDSANARGDRAGSGGEGISSAAGCIGRQKRRENL